MQAYYYYRLSTMLLLSVTLSLFLFPWSTTGTSILSYPQSLSSVECPSSQTTFVVTTKLKLEGRNELLSTEEQQKFSEIFQGIYNSLAQRSCDSYFRRISALSWVSMGNNLGETVQLGAMVGANSTTNSTTNITPNSTEVQINNKTRTRNLEVNSTSAPGVDIVYQLVGQCRGCSLQNGGFELYDDAFRRTLRAMNGIHGIRELEVPSTEDCQCVVGTRPTTPQAPGVKECVDEMNLEMETIRKEDGIMENLTMMDLIQLEDCGVVILDDIEDEEEEETEESFIDLDMEVERNSEEESDRTNRAPLSEEEKDTAFTVTSSAMMMRWKKSSTWLFLLLGTAAVGFSR
jgi:hypothetical protein